MNDNEELGNNGEPIPNHNPEPIERDPKEIELAIANHCWLIAKLQRELDALQTTLARLEKERERHNENLV